ncbi:MAG: hypothetical protein H6741_22900 [Alphaproteobacteria bacterium]|nr:hypothetical protein [Alphaproteobacteria bacterium]
MSTPLPLSAFTLLVLRVLGALPATGRLMARDRQVDPADPMLRSGIGVGSFSRTPQPASA